MIVPDVAVVGDAKVALTQLLPMIEQAITPTGSAYQRL